MKVSVSEAKAQLTDLVKRAEGGEEVVLTRHGHPAVRLVPAAQATTRDERLAVIRAVRAAAPKDRVPGPSAARSQDFLYDEFGLPE